MRSTAGTLPKQLGEVVWAHARNSSELRKSEIAGQVLGNVVDDALQSVTRQTASVNSRHVRSYRISFEQIDGKRVGKRFAIHLARG